MFVTDIHGNKHEIVVGTNVRFYPKDGRSHHAAFAVVTKVKRKTFECVEIKGSYKAGKEWNVHMDTTFAIETQDEKYRGTISFQKTYWIND